MARSVFIDLIGRDRASHAFDTAAASAERAAGKMTGASARMARTGAVMSKSITLPLLAVAAVSVKTAIDYQKSMTLLQTAGGESARKMAAINKGIQDVAIKTGTSLKDLTDGMYTVAKAGSQKWSAAGQLMVLQAAAEGAKAENVDLATATNALTSVMMSYHMSASQAVAAQNMIVVGAGRAKTTMQQYAGALSTVIPVASAAHISFQQVAGAIATMTQHGTSADEATQELSHTIRNLLSPNQVAQKAMQQLGLSVTDVSANLGKRGLTGTIDLITNAIAHHMGPAGMVAVSAFKKSQSASADLNAELSHMPKNLASISTQFSTGKMSYKDYYKAVKDLGGQAFVLGKNFLSTYQQAHGFNDLLKSGSPGVRTFAGTLKNVLGTATSMNTALQLGGENAAYFKTATADVGKAAHATQGDVLGWAKTQDTLAVKMDKAKASLQVLGLEIGNALIPAVTQIVGGIRNLVEWFTHLSGTQKTILMWSLGVLAALGPLLSITGRLASVATGIGLFVSRVSTQLAGLAGASTSSALRFGTAMSGITAGLAGASIGVAVGSFTRNASTTSKWLGALGSAAAGAAIGFSMGGGVGAAVGGLAGGVAGLATAFLGAGKAADNSAQIAQQALLAQQSTANDLLGVLKSINGEYNDQYKNQAIAELQKPIAQGGGHFNTLDYAHSAGVAESIITNAALGNAAAIQHLIDLQNKYANATTTAGTNKGDWITVVLQQLAKLSPAVADAEHKYEQGLAAAGKTTVATRLLAGGVRNLSKELVAGSTSLTTDTNALIAHGAEAHRNTQVIRENAQAIVRASAYQLAHGHTVDAVRRSIAGQAGAMMLTLHNLGFNDAAVRKLMASLHLYSAIQASPKVDAKTEAAQSKIHSVGSQLSLVNRMNANPAVTVADHASGQLKMIRDLENSLRDKTITVTVSQKTIGQLGSTRRSQVPSYESNAAGGPVNDGWFTVGEQGWEAGYKSGNKVSIFSNPMSQKIMGFSKVPGFASGSAGTSAAARSAALGSVRGDFGTLIGALRSTASELRSAFSALIGDARAGGASPEAIDKLSAAEKRLLALQKQRNTVTGQLTRAQAALTAVQAKYNQTWMTSRDATLGSFDVTTAGASTSPFTDRQGGPTTITSILSGLRATAAKASQFRSVLARLVKEGLNKNLVSQLAAAGPAALAQAQALASATPAQMRTLNATYSGLNVTSSAIGKLAATDMYGAGVQSAQGLVNGLKSRQTALNDAITRIAQGMIAQLKKTLGIHSPSKVMFALGGHTAEGYRLGIVDRLEDVRQAGKDIGNAATPAGQNADWRRTDSRGGNTFHIYEQSSAAATATAVVRRLDLAGYGSS